MHRVVCVRRVVSSLRARGAHVIALVRDKAKAAKLLPPVGTGLDFALADVYQYATLPSAFKDANAVIVCSGARDPRDPFGPFNIDYQGTRNLLSVAQSKGVKKFVLVTSIGADDPFNPLNLFWGVSCC